MGVDRPPSSFFAHRRLLPSPPSGLHFSTRPFSIDTRFCCGPRQFGQSSGSVVAAKPLTADVNNNDSINTQIARLLKRRLIRALRLGIEIIDRELREDHKACPAVKLYPNGREPRRARCWQRLFSAIRWDGSVRYRAR